MIDAIHSATAFTPPTGATLDHKTSTSLRPYARPSRRPWRLPPPPPPPTPQMAAGRWIRRGRRQGTCPCPRHAKGPQTTPADLRWLGQRKDQSSEPRPRLDLPRPRSDLERRRARAASARPRWRRPERATRRSRRPPHLHLDAIRRNQTHSDAISGTLTQSDAITEAMRCHQRPSEAIRVLTETAPVAIRRHQSAHRDSASRNQTPSECSPRQRQTPGSPTVIVNVEPYASSPELERISRSIPYAA